MNYLDITLLTIILIITIRGLFRGLITELLILVGIIFGFFAATFFHGGLQSLILSLFPGVPDSIAKVIAFVLIFIGVNIVIRILVKLMNKIATFTFLQPINKIAGALFAFTKVTMILSILILVIDLIPGSGFFTEKIGRKESALYEPVRNFAPFLYRTLISSKSAKDLLPPAKTISDSLKTKIIS